MLKEQGWLNAHLDFLQKKIKMFYLPTYSPELNPDEYLNNDMKRQVHAGQINKNRTELGSRVRSVMRHFQSQPERIQSYFKHPKTMYAANK